MLRRCIPTPATDAESDTITWSVGGADAGLFAIDADGALTFRASPNFEVPTDVADPDDSTVVAGDNVYEITITATDNGAPVEASDAVAVTVTVTNVDEEGSISDISGTARVGEELTAGSVTDPDGTVTGITYQWQSSPSSSPDYANISGAGTTSAYTLRDSDVGRTIQVIATYTDPQGANKTATSAPTATVDTALTVSAGADQPGVLENMAVNLEGAITNPGTDPTILWTHTLINGSLPSTPLTITGSDMEDASFTTPYVTADTTLTFELSVTLSGGGNPSVTDSVDIVIPNVAQPRAIASVTVNVGSPAQSAFAVSWTQGSGTDKDPTTGFDVEYKVTGADDNTYTAANVAVTAETAAITGLTADTGYTVRVRAKAGSGTTAEVAGDYVTNTGTTAADTTTAPGAPTGLTADAGDTTVTLAWTAPSATGGAAITGYEVRRSTTAGTYDDTNPWTAISDSAAAIEYIVTGLTNDTAYFFQVRAVNSVGEGEASNEATATPTAAPATPTLVLGEVTPTTITLSWGAVDNADSYTLTRIVDGINDIEVATGNVLTATDAGLTPETPYKYVVTATNSVGTSADSNEVEARTDAAPTAPVTPTLELEGAAHTSIVLSWDAVDGAESYTVTRIVAGGNVDVPITGLTATDTGLTPETTYGYVITATNSAGTSSPSAEFPARTGAAPTSPAVYDFRDDPHATDGDKVVITFTSSHTGDFKIEFDPGSTTDFRIDNAANPYIHTETVGYDYDGNVSIFLGLDAVIDSAPITTGPAPTEPPAAPVLTARTTTVSTVVLEWTAVTNADSYTLTRIVAGEDDVTVATTTALTATDTGLTAATEYKYVITATVGSRTSANSNEVAATTLPAPTAPDAPVLTAGATTDTTISLSWTAVPNADSYTLTRIVAGEDDVTVATTTALTATDTGLIAATEYKYVITATVGGRTSANSNEVTATTLPAPTAPDAPVLTAGTTTTSTIVLEWTAVTNADSYTLTRVVAGEDDVEVATTTALTATDENLEPATEYKYVITATVGSRTSVKSNEVTARTDASPTAPAAPTLILGAVTSTSVVITWTAVDGTLAYCLVRSDKTGCIARVFHTTLGGDLPAYTDTDVTPGTTYTYHVIALNDASEQSNPSAVLVVTTPPVLVAGTITDTSITLSWGAVDNADSYTLTRIVAGEDDVTVPTTTALTATDTGLTAATEYRYVITATVGSRTTANSNEVAATTLTTPIEAPAAPVLAQGAVTPTSIVIQWTAVNGATGYVLFRDGVSITTTTTETTYTDTGLTAGTAYTYHATSTNAAGTSDNSADLPVTTTTTADDVTPPVIAVNEDSFSVELGAEYTPFTFTATDDADGDITSGVVVGGDTVNASAVGAYDVTFDVDDATGNSAETVTRTVTVTDTTPPVITPAGSSETIELTAANTYTELGATVTDNDPAYSGAVAITGDTPDTSAVGAYTVLYNAPDDAAGNTPDQQSIAITVVDTTAPAVPAITTAPATVGSSPITIEGTAEAGATVALFNGTTSAGTTTADGSGDFSFAAVALSEGANTFTATATDVAGNESGASSELVITLDTTAPVITVVPPAVTLQIDSAPPNLLDGVTADDGSAVTTTGTVEVGTLDDYIITYDSVDASGNAATSVTRTYTVTDVPDTTAPTVTLGTITAGVIGTPQDHDITFNEAVTGLVVDAFSTSTFVTVNGVSGSGAAYTINFTPTAATFSLILTANSVSDLAATPNTGPAAEASVNGTATAANQDPIADAGPNQTVETNALVTLDGSGSNDPDVGDTLTYAWTHTMTDGSAPSPAIALTNANTAGPTFTAPAAAGAYAFELIVTDNGTPSASATDTVTITVTEPAATNTAPRITAGNAAPNYAENADAAVATYTATDTESNNIAWSVTGADASFFAIDADGVLTFTAAPDFEDARGATYTITITATETDGAPSNLPSVPLAVTVTVTNVDEDGSISAISGTAQVGVELTAGTVTDPDGAVTGITYQWQSAASGGTYTTISGAGTTSTYTPDADDEGKTIQVIATYTDPQGSGKTATSAPTAAVEAATPTKPTVVAPATPIEFAENDTGTVHSFSATPTGTRTIASFALGGVDAGDFSITNAGVLTFITAPNFEVPLDANTANVYEIAITATDDAGEISDSVAVTVMVTNAEDAGSVSAISGIAQVGEILTAGTVVTDEDSLGVINITGYQWQRGDAAGEGNTDIDSETGNTYGVVAADDGNTLRVVVSYIDDFGNNTDEAASASTAAVIGTDETPTAPATPTLAQGAVTDTSIEITWTAVDGATEYELFRDGVSIITTTTETSYTDTGLAPGTEYTYHATSTNAVGTSDNSADLDVTTTTTADVTAPVIAVNEDSFSVELGAEYTPFTFTATDNTDGDITDNVVVGGDTVNTGVVGTYDVTFDVDDAAGNPAETVTRTVTVTDTTPPVITPAGSSETIELTATNTYTEQGATVTDNDPAYSATVAVSGDAPDTSVIGVYTVLYDAPDDAAGNTPAQQSIVITVVDTTPPVITVNPLTVTLPLGSSQPVLAGVTTDDGSPITASGTVDVSTPGDYMITYNSVDASDNAAEPVTRTYTVTATPDTTAPTVTLGTITAGVIGTAQDHGITFDEAVTGLEVSDFSTSTDATVNGVSGSGAAYTINFTPNAAAFSLILAANSVTDLAASPNTGPETAASADGMAAPANTAPVADAGDSQAVDTSALVTLDGSASSDPDTGDTLTYAWAHTLTDGNVPATPIALTDGDTASPSFTAPDTAGVLTFELTVTDDATPSASHTATVTITVTRPLDTVAPVITLRGASPVEVPQGATYTDLGATASDDRDGDLSASIALGGDTVDTDTVGDYTLTYDVSDAAGNAAETVTRVVRVVIVRDLDTLNRVILPEVARAMADQNVSAIARRIEQARLSGIAGNASSASLGGATNLTGIIKSQGRSIADGRFDMQQILGNSNFVLPLRATDAGEADGTQLTLWGAGDYRSLEGAEGVRWDGDLLNLQVGLDAHLNARTILGVSVSRSQARLGYTDPSLATRGDYDLDMTSVHPYLGWSSGSGSFWMTLGYGNGEVDISEAGAQDFPSSDLSMRTLALGASGLLMETGITTLRLKGEALSSTVKLDGNAQMAAMERDVSRLRMTLEASRNQTLASGGRYESSLETGLRYDGGDGETGTGVELGGSLRYASPNGGFTMEGKARTLVAGKGDAEEWGLSGAISLRPSADGRGLSFSLTPSYGVTASGVQALWQQGLDDAEAQGTGSPAYSPTLQIRLDYGMYAPRGPGLLTPYTELRFGDSGNTYRLGLQWQRSQMFDLKLVAEREEGQITVDHRIYLEGEIAF